jgi:hypothetical protein
MKDRMQLDTIVPASDLVITLDSAISVEVTAYSNSFL